jgi:hypothetical protein
LALATFDPESASTQQQVAISGATMGYYLFKRCEANQRAVGNPWEVDEEPVLLDEEHVSVEG